MIQIIAGKIKSAQKVVIYGPEGIGKSTFAASFPEALFIDTEGSTTHMNVARTQTPTSWAMLFELIKDIKVAPSLCRTVVLDTADWAEILCTNFLCARAQVKGIEDFGYGKGYTYLEEEFGKLLNLLTELIGVGINVVITAHAQMRKFEQPDEMGAYDRFELKLEKKTAALVKEWADMVLFANYKTYVVNVDNQGAAKGKNKAQGGSRVMYTTHHPCWDAKNRHNLPPELPFEFSSIAHLIGTEPGAPVQTTAPAVVKTDPAPEPPRIVQEPAPEPVAQQPAQKPAEQPQPDMAATSYSGIPKALIDLMQANHVAAEEIQAVVADRGYYPKGTPIKNYDPDFIAGVLVGAWVQVYEMIQKRRNDGGMPFDA